MADDKLDVDELGLEALGERNTFLKNQLDSMVEGAKAEGGVGATKRDEQAREFAQKQVRVEGEIFDRLSAIHEDRSMRSQELDEAFEAPIADSPDQWANDPSHFDWPGIDTPRS
jgi:hypothetical protein